MDADEALLLVTIRSDAYGAMQSARTLAGIDQLPLSLGPVPHGEIARVIREPSEVLRRKAGPAAPVAASQMHAVLSPAAVTTRVPSGLKLAELTIWVWPRRTAISLAVAASQMRAVWSTDAPVFDAAVVERLQAEIERPIAYG